MDMERTGLHWRWVDRISHVDTEAGEVVAHRHVPKSDFYFEHHFQSFPLVPGVLLVEMMAHSAALLSVLRVLESISSWAHYFLAGTNKTRFYRAVLPDSNITMKATLLQGDDEQLLARTSAHVNDERVARSEVMLQRITGDWLGDQDEHLIATMRRVLDDELRARFNIV